jgi:hypothetical protein
LRHRDIIELCGPCEEGRGDDLEANQYQPTSVPTTTGGALIPAFLLVQTSNALKFRGNKPRVRMNHFWMIGKHGVHDVHGDRVLVVMVTELAVMCQPIDEVITHLEKIARVLVAVPLDHDVCESQCVVTFRVHRHRFVYAEEN